MRRLRQCGERMWYGEEMGGGYVGKMSEEKSGGR